MAEANKMYLKSAKPTRTMTELLKKVRKRQRETERARASVRLPPPYPH